MLGRAAVAMWWDIAPEMREEWEEWHSVEHMPERLAIPGFLRGTRCIALSGEPSYFVLYEASSLATLTTGAYVERLNNPTPWSRKMMPCHRNMVRSMCLVRDGYGGGVPRMLATVRLSRAPTGQLPRGKGLTGAHFLESQPDNMVPQTTEQKIRGGDKTADWVLLVGGYDEHAVKTAAAAYEGAASFYRPAYSLSPGEIA
jgi:hypothetical protein